MKFSYRGKTDTCRWCGGGLAAIAKSWARNEIMHPPPGNCRGCTSGPDDDHVAGDWELVPGPGSKYRCRRCRTIAWGVKSVKITMSAASKGYRGNGFFCSAMCGYLWAVEKAKGGVT